MGFVNGAINEDDELRPIFSVGRIVSVMSTRAPQEDEAEGEDAFASRWQIGKAIGMLPIMQVKN
jgi:hypothetical protein